MEREKRKRDGDEERRKGREKVEGEGDEEVPMGKEKGEGEGLTFLNLQLSSLPSPALFVLLLPFQICSLINQSQQISFPQEGLTSFLRPLNFCPTLQLYYSTVHYYTVSFSLIDVK